MTDVAKNNSACFSGHRRVHFDMTESYMGDIMQRALKSAISAAIADGFTTFYTGMAKGFDIIAAEIVLEQKYATAAQLRLISVLPFSGHEDGFGKPWHKRHDNILRNADEIISLNPGHTPGCYHERNRYLVDHSNRLICLYSGKPGGTKHTHDYAEKSGIQIINLWPQIIAQDPLHQQQPS